MGQCGFLTRNDGMVYLKWKFRAFQPWIFEGTSWPEVAPFYLLGLEGDPPQKLGAALPLTLWAHELDSGQEDKFTFIQINWVLCLQKVKKKKNLAGCVCPKSEWIETPKEAPAAKGNPGQVLLSFFTGLFRTTLGVSSFLFWYFTLIHNKKTYCAYELYSREYGWSL